MWKKLLPLLLVPVLLAGCRGTFTNLTPRQQPRDPNNLYPVGVSFVSRQKSLRWESIEPYVVVGVDAYPLRKTPIAENRWEGLIPVPADVSTVTYRYRFKYQYDYFGGPRSDSQISPEYQLKILPQ